MQSSQQPTQFPFFMIRLGFPHWQTESSFDRPHISHQALFPFHLIVGVSHTGQVQNLIGVFNSGILIGSLILNSLPFLWSSAFPDPRRWHRIVRLVFQLLFSRQITCLILRTNLCHHVWQPFLDILWSFCVWAFGSTRVVLIAEAAAF